MVLMFSFFLFEFKSIPDSSLALYSNSVKIPPVSVDVAVPELVSPDKEEVNTISTVDNSESTTPDNVNEVD